MKTLPDIRNIKLSYFLKVFLALGMIILLSAWGTYNIMTKSRLRALGTRQMDSARFFKTLINQQFRYVISDLMFLANQYELNIHSWNDNGRVNIGEEFVKFARIKRIFDRIRIMNYQGMEVVRINYNDGNPEIVPPEKLQYKGYRYYYNRIINLNDGDIYISPLDPNVEHEVVEFPFKPVMRFATPVFDKLGGRLGVLVLDYKGASLLDALRAAANLSDAKMLLINPDGYYLSGPTPEEEWGFVTEERADKGFKMSFPREWKIISQFESGMIHDEHGIFAYLTSDNLSDEKGYVETERGVEEVPAQLIIDTPYFWKVVSFISPQEIQAHNRRYLLESLIGGALLFVIAGGLSWAASDILTKRHLRRLELQQLAHIDPLTMLPNRAAFNHNLEVALSQRIVTGRKVGLLFLDLDGFKAINDTHGHDIGDEVLVAVGRRLQCSVRPSDTVSRLGGDEFTVILTDIDEDEDAEMSANRIIRSVSQPIAIGDLLLKVGVSVGIAVAPTHGTHAQTLIKVADSGMYLAKNSGKGRAATNCGDPGKMPETRFKDCDDWREFG